MSDQLPTRMELSRGMNEAITPYFNEKQFKVIDLPEDDPIHTIWASFGDGTHSRRFTRAVPLGYETFELRFTQYSDSETGQGFIGVGTEFGIHVTSVEQLEIELNIVPNPYRLGKFLPDVWQIEREILQIRGLNEISKANEQITQIVEADGAEFWSKYQTLDDIMNYFNTWSKFERYSPKGSSHVVRYFLIIAYLKRDRTLFNQVIAEYKPYIQMDVYRNAFDRLVETLSKEFKKLD